MNPQTLHVKYRPETLDMVIGQDAVVNSLAGMVKSGRIPHTFLFTGPSGTGKTTLARIVANIAGVSGNAIEQFDAARFGQVEQVRDLVTNSRYMGLNNSNSRRCFIIDEAHALSKAAWQAMLLVTEEPPEHLYWIFCTTEAEKIPKTIKTRAHAFDLKPIRWDVMVEYLVAIAEEDKLKIKQEFLEMAARTANGSMRQALVNLSLLDGIISKTDAAQLLASAELGDAAEPVLQLARMLVTGKGFTWPNARKLLEVMADIPPETIRMQILAYTTNTLLKEESPGQAQRLLAVLDAFSKPCASSERMAPILLAVGSLLQ